jgi:hypothetical protein
MMSLPLAVGNRQVVGRRQRRAEVYEPALEGSAARRRAASNAATAVEVGFGLNLVWCLSCGPCGTHAAADPYTSNDGVIFPVGA